MKSFDIVPLYKRDKDKINSYMEMFESMGFFYTDVFNEDEYKDYPYEIEGLFMKEHN
jgi:hypothetical protein